MRVSRASGFEIPSNLPDVEALRRLSSISNLLSSRKSLITNWNVQSEEERKNVIMKAAAERKEVSLLEDQVLTACRMIQAQFRLNHIVLDRATFYFQWVYTGKEAKRDPKQPIQKLLYLVCVHDLACYDVDLQ